MAKMILAVASVAVLSTTFPSSASAGGGKANLPQAASVPQTPIRGADISFTLQEERAGTTVTDGQAVQPVEAVLSRLGANYVRLRVWVDPPSGYSTIDSALALGRRAQAQGMRILLDLHYSDFWADPTYQAIPASWQGQSLPVLAQTVRRYTADALARFTAQGTPVSMIQIGNEISNGILWPLGQVNRTDGTHWAEMAMLVNAGIAGARDASPSTQVMLHIESGTDQAR
ncbi:MAG: Arabinogalactan endo,4-beta-galactosidase, partial [Jatrophihabitantaceae bacterium]|nr:Arabinogalactan endo,4-beta-galactosidase [Jatrophihabitantaceae bacterium]